MAASVQASATLQLLQSAQTEFQCFDFLSLLWSERQNNGDAMLKCWSHQNKMTCLQEGGSNLFHDFSCCKKPGHGCSQFYMHSKLAIERGGKAVCGGQSQRRKSYGNKNIQRTTARILIKSVQNRLLFSLLRM